MLAYDNLYNKYCLVLQALNNLQYEHDLLVRQNLPPVIIHSLRSRIELTKAELEIIRDQLVYINPFTGERELPVHYESFQMN
jgi:hypothetical protein